MRHSQFAIDQRRAQLIKLLTKVGSISVSELSQYFKISLPTIRRDLDYLEEQGLVTRRYGKATILEKASNLDSKKELFASYFNDKEYLQKAKKTIARTAADLIEKNDTIFLGGGTTTILILDYINVPGVTIITNNLRILKKTPPIDCTILLSGGEITTQRSVLSGDLSLHTLEFVTPSKVILGCSGLTAHSGVSAATIEGVSVNSLMLRKSVNSFLLTDSSKVGLEVGFKFADLNQFDSLITDTNIDDSYGKSLLDAGLKNLVQVKVEK